MAFGGRQAPFRRFAGGWGVARGALSVKIRKAPPKNGGAFLILAERVGLIRRFPAPHPCGAPAWAGVRTGFPADPSNLWGLIMAALPIKIRKAPPKNGGAFLILAERVGFEPTEGYKPSTVFKTAAFNRSATSPGIH